MIKNFIAISMIVHLLSCNNEKTKPKETSINTIPKNAINNDDLSSQNYNTLKENIIKEFPNAKPGKWGEFVKGVDEDLVTNKKIIALTFDACGGPHGSGYDVELINFLRKKNIPATLFFTGKWIDANPEIFQQLSKDTLFEIENHGLNHRPCSIDGESEYGIKGTQNIGEVIDEMELNERKIEKITGRRPVYFRSATACTDETCAKIAHQLGLQIVSFDILSGDAVPNTPKTIIKRNLISNAKSGAIIIMHMNHPLWNTYEALSETIPILQMKGYTFVKLEYYKLKQK